MYVLSKWNEPGFVADETKNLLTDYFSNLVAEETAPSGMLARGHYNAVSKFVDDDNVTHLEFAWAFDIKKDWQ